MPTIHTMPDGRTYTTTCLAEYKITRCLACGECYAYLDDDLGYVCKTCRKELVEMPRLHDMIGRRIVAADGPISVSVLQWRRREEYEPVLAEMGLIIRDGLIDIRGDTFHEGWDMEAQQWKPTTCALYRFYDDKGVLLYVGISARIHERMKAHRDKASWFEVAARVDIQHLPNRREALRAEELAIKTEKPIHNVVHNLRPTPLVMPPRRKGD